MAASVVAYGTVAVGARWARAVLLDRTRAVGVSVLGGQAVPSRRLDRGGFGVGRGPWMDAVGGGVTPEFGSTQDVCDAYPGIDERSVPGKGAVITVPLGSAVPRSGAVTFGFDQPGPLTDPVRAIVAEVARLAAYAAQRALVNDAENRAAETFQHAISRIGWGTSAG